MTLTPTDIPVRLADKAEMKQILDEVNHRLGFVPDTEATPDKVRELMLRDGIRPDENASSREILRQRYEDD